MLEDKGEAKKKGNVKYNVLIVPDIGTEAVKQFSLNMQVIKTFVAGVALLMIAALLYCVILTRELNGSKNEILVLEVQVSDLTRQNEWLITQKAEQKEELTKVSAELEVKVEQEKEREEEIAKSFIPSGFPLTERLPTVRRTKSWKEILSRGLRLSREHV